MFLIYCILITYSVIDKLIVSLLNPEEENRFNEGYEFWNQKISEFIQKKEEEGEQIYLDMSIIRLIKQRKK